MEVDVDHISIFTDDHRGEIDAALRKGLLVNRDSRTVRILINAFTAIIVPPQAAILAVGEIADRVAAIDGKPVVRPMITLTLSCDHRVVDGARAAKFMHTLVESLQ